MKRTFLSLLAAFTIAFCSAAAEYAVLGKSAPVFENSKGQPLMNQFDEQVNVLPGMAFEIKGSTEHYWIVAIPELGNAYIPKESCTKSDAIGVLDGIYAMNYDGEAYPVRVKKSDKALDTYEIEFAYPGYVDETLVGTNVSPDVVAITRPADNNAIVGFITRLSGKVKIWIYENYILNWR